MDANNTLQQNLTSAKVDKSQDGPSRIMCNLGFDQINMVLLATLLLFLIEKIFWDFSVNTQVVDDVIYLQFHYSNLYITVSTIFT